MEPEENKSKLKTILLIIFIILTLLRLTAYFVDNWDSVEKGFKDGRAAARQ
jgi:hypothetical protein